MVLSNRYTALRILVSHSTATKIGCSVHCKIVQIRVILKYKLFTLNYIYALELIIYLLIYLDSLRIYLHGCKKILLYLAIVAHWQSLRNVYMSARCYALYHYGNGNYLLVQKYLSLIHLHHFKCRLVVTGYTRKFPKFSVYSQVPIK